MSRSLWNLLVCAFIGVLFCCSGAVRASASASSLAKAVYGDDLEAVEKVVDELVQAGGKKGAEAIFKVALSSRLDIEPEAYEILLKGLARLTDPAAMEFYSKMLKSRQVPPRILVVEAAARMQGTTGVDLILAGLKDKENSVVETALEAVRKRRPKEAVPVLIDLVEAWTKRRAKDAVYYNIKDTLIELTGEDLPSVDDWRKWWEVNSATFDPKKIREAKRTARKRVLGGKEDPTFFGVPVSSKNAVFVIDTSASMLLVQKDDIPGLTKVRGVDVTEVVEQPKERMTPENARLAKYWTRIEMAKRQLCKVLGQLKPPTKINIIAFNSKVFPFSKRSRTVTSSVKKKAIKWVRNLRPRAYTDTLGALKAAFASDSKVNTIYFLSDGVPSKDGKTVDDMKEILNKVLKMNRFRKIKIHTFGFHPFTMDGFPNPQLQQANKFLKELASKTGGTFTAMKVDPNEKPPPDFR